MIKRGAYLLLFLMTFLYGFSQEYLLNPSFEGSIGQAGTPPYWDSCYTASTPNVQPGLYGVYHPPSDGETYLGLLTRLNGSLEDCYSVLSIPLSKDSCYKFQIDLAFWEYMGNYPYVDPIIIRIFGSNENCVKDNILWTSPLIDNTDWETFEFIIHNEEYDITDITIETDFAQPNYYKGYMLLDNIRITQYPQFELGNDTTLTLCSNDSVVLDPGPGFETYLWQDGSTTQTYIADTTGLYWVQAFNEEGCSWTDSVYITVEEYLLMESEMIDSTLVCEGQEITITASIINGAEPYSYEWLTLPDTTESVTVVVESTIYYPVLITDLCGNTLLDSIKIVMVPSPDVDLGPDTLICPVGGEYTIHAGSEFSQYSWQDGSTDSVFTLHESGIYWVEVTSGFGCTARDSIMIDLFPPVSLELGNDTTLCVGESVTFHAGDEFIEYLWQDYSTDSNYTAYTTGTYWVTVIDINGCEASDSIYASFIIPPMVNIGPDTSMCTGEEIILNAGSEFNSYLWQNSDTSQYHLVSQEGWYWVTVDNGCGSDTDSLYVEAYPSPEPHLGNDTTLCAGEYFLLQPGGQYITYLWQDNSTSNDFYVYESGFYSVTVTNIYNCVGSDEIVVDISSPEINLGQDSTICYNDSLYLSPGDNFAYYLWQDGSNEPYYHITSSGAYSVFVEDEFGCTDEDDVELVLVWAPTVDLGEDQIMCSGDIVTLEVPVGPYTYLWNGVEGTATYKVSHGGECTVQLLNMCGDAVDSIYIEEVETPSIDLGEDVLLNPDESIELDAGFGYDSYLWQDGSVNQFYLVSPDNVNMQDPNYSVEVMMGPCMGSDTVEVFLFIVELPIVFTPNNDGANDFFLPMDNSWNGITSHHISVFNRWGEEVWESESFENGWDGKRNGNTVADGTYFWVLEVYYGPDNLKQVQKGNVTVLGSGG